MRKGRQDKRPSVQSMAQSAYYDSLRTAELERVTACLLDHYLNCCEGNRDALALDAERLLPNWRERMSEWEPTR